MVEKVSVIGFGAMGSGIAEYLSINGVEVQVFETSREVLRSNLVKVKESIAKLKARGRTREGTDDIIGRLHFADTLESCARDSEIIIEAVYENATLKAEIARKVSGICPDNALVCTNTSSIPVTFIQKGAKRPDRCVGFHWFNPPVLLDLTEIVKGDQTSMESIGMLSKFSTDIGKRFIIAKRDIRGFIGNRIVRSLRYHSMLLTDRGILTPKQIDSALIFKVGLPMGILALTDFTGGIKLEYDESKTYNEIKKEVPHYEPSPGYDRMYREITAITFRMVQKNRIAFRSGRGIYDYPEPGVWRMPQISEEEGRKIDPIPILAPMYNQALYLVNNEICSRDDIETALIHGFKWKTGIFKYFDKGSRNLDAQRALREFASKFPDLKSFYSYQGV